MKNKKYFLTVVRGRFTERQLAGHPCETFQKVEGHLVNISYKPSLYGDIIRLHMIDEDNFYILSLFANSRAAHALYMLIKNIDLLLPVAFCIKEVEGKDVFYAIQHNKSVRWYYGIDSINVLPANIEERLLFLKEMVVTEIIPSLQKKKNPYRFHLIYKPFTAGLQGGYFNKSAKDCHIVDPTKENYNVYGRN